MNISDSVSQTVCYRENMFPSMMNKRPYKCKYCSGTYETRGNLDTHLLTHAGIKQHSCSECSKQFSQKAQLDIHIRRVHLKIKPHKCGACTLSFSTRSELKLHLGTHDKPKSYPCPLCPAAFVQKVTLTKHISSQHAGKPIYYTARHFLLKAKPLQHQRYLLVLSNKVSIEDCHEAFNDHCISFWLLEMQRDHPAMYTLSPLMANLG